MLVVGLTVGATLLFTREGSDGPSEPATSSAPSDLTSANDSGPVAIVTDEPTCRTFNTINNSLADIQQQGWGQMRGTLGPLDSWTPNDRQQVETVAKAMRNAADQAVPLAKQTPHRVVREIYEQFVAYGRAYADSIATYVPADDGLASANVNASSALIGICNSIQYGSAGRSLALDSQLPPTSFSIPSDPANPDRVIKTAEPICDEWTARLDKFNADSSAWQDRDASVAATEWTPERRALEETAAPLLASYAVDLARIGRASENQTFEDLAVAASVYIQAYIASTSTYTNADSWLSYTAFRIANLIAGACRAEA